MSTLMSTRTYRLSKISAPRPAKATVAVTLKIDGVSVTVPGRHLGDARRCAAGHQHSETVRHRQPRSLRLLPPVPGGDRRHARLSRRPAPRRSTGHEGAHANAKAREPAPQRHGALHFRSSAGLPDLSRPTATANCRTWPARSACAKCATATKATNHLSRCQGQSNPTSPSIRASASSAPAACAPAKKRRARLP